MSEDKDAGARRRYEAAKDDFALQIPWADLPEFQKNYWRAVDAGDAGAKED